VPQFILIIVIFVVLFVGLLFWLTQHTERVGKDKIGIKMRRNKLFNIVEGGTEVKLLPVIDQLVYISTEQQKIVLDKYLVIGKAGQAVEIKGTLIYQVIEPDKFIEDLEYNSDSDCTEHINLMLRKKIHQLIKQDLWGISKIDLMKNEDRILKNLTENIIYNLELTEDELEQFTLQFRVTN